MAKKNKKKKSEETQPMPSLIFHEGSLENSDAIETPNADQIEKELRSAPRPPNLSHLTNYNRSAHRLMWVGVIIITVIVCAMWSYSIYAQLSNVKWSNSSETNFINDTKKNWQQAFYGRNGKTLTTDEQLSEIKENLSKLFAGAAASSSVNTSTSGASSTP